MSALILAAMICSQANPATEGPAKIKELQKERIDTLKDLVDQLGKLYGSGLVESGEVLEARMLLFKAELDAAETDRVGIFQKTVEALKAQEELARSKVRVGRGTNAAVLKIKARRLEVEIQLEQEKIKEAKEKK